MVSEMRRSHLCAGNIPIVNCAIMWWGMLSWRILGYFFAVGCVPDTIPPGTQNVLVRGTKFLCMCNHTAMWEWWILAGQAKLRDFPTFPRHNNLMSTASLMKIQAWLSLTFLGMKGGRDVDIPDNCVIRQISRNKRQWPPLLTETTLCRATQNCQHDDFLSSTKPKLVNYWAAQNTKLIKYLQI